MKPVPPVTRTRDSVDENPLADPLGDSFPVTGEWDEFDFVDCVMMRLADLSISLSESIPCRSLLKRKTAWNQP
jgi:hypothetical protein